jgi:hypothetical protein
VGFYYGEVAAEALTKRLAELSSEPRLQHYSLETHHEDEVWHARVFADLVSQVSGTQDLPPPPPWADDLLKQIRTCTNYLELVIGSLVVEASAVFLLELQSQFAGELGRTFGRILQQEKGHVAFATHYLRESMAQSDVCQRQELRSQLLDAFRYMRDRIRPPFIACHLDPVLPLLGIDAQDYRDRARSASRKVLRSILANS